MAKNNKAGVSTSIENNTITLDFVQAYKEFEKPCVGTMQIPTESKEVKKEGWWSKLVAFFTKK